MTTTQGRGGHGGHGYGGVYYDPWVFYGLGDDAACASAHKDYVLGGEGELSTGTGALLVLAILAWVVLEADKRVPR